jgi:hypothetical protein
MSATIIGVLIIAAIVLVVVAVIAHGDEEGY